MRFLHQRRMTRLDESIQVIIHSEMYLLRLSQVLLPFLPTLILTYHWQLRSSWTQTLERGHNRCQIDTRRIPGVDCGQSLLGELAQILGWSWDPRDSVPLMCHCPHRNCEQKKKNHIGVSMALSYLRWGSSLIWGVIGRFLHLILDSKNYIELEMQLSGSMLAQSITLSLSPKHCKQTNKPTTVNITFA